MKKFILPLFIVVSISFLLAGPTHAVKRAKSPVGASPLYGEKQPPVATEASENARSSERARWPLTVAIYKVTTNGFSLNGSEVREINRLAMQACYDAGLKCSGRDETASNVQREQGYGGRGKIGQAEYVAEFTLAGSTENALKLGIPGGLHIGGGYGHSIGGGWIGGGTYTDLSGLGIKLSSMTLTGQITSSADGTLAFSDTESKIGLKGSFIIGEATSSNSKKLLSTFRKMFEEFKERNQ